MISKLKQVEVGTVVGTMLLLCFALPVGVFAINTVADGFRLENTTTRAIEINAHGVCHGTWNNSGTTDYFVPTKSASEWLAFRNNTPSDITLYGCPVTDCVGEWTLDTSGSPISQYNDNCVQAPSCDGSYKNPDAICRIEEYPRIYSHTTSAQNGGLACSTADGTTDGSTGFCAGDVIGGSLSFLAGTMIHTPQGDQPIETIAVGDQVYGSGGTNTVLELKRNSYGKNVYGFNDTGLFVTNGHPFMTPEGWKAFEAEVARRINPELEIGQLVVGDYILKSDGTAEKIETIYFEYMAVPVYNFHVDGTNDYYADGYWVHNK